MVRVTDRKTVLSLLLMLFWEEFGMKCVPIDSVFEIGEVCVRCGEAVEDLEHIVHHVPAWAAERREVVLPASALGAPAPLCQASWLAACSEKADTVVIRTLDSVELDALLTLVKVFFCPTWAEAISLSS
eukprot:4741451-Amphidinium_carterae.1